MRVAALFAIVLVVAAAIPVSVLLLRDGADAPPASGPTASSTAIDSRSPFHAGVLRNLEIRTDLSASGFVQLTNGSGVASAALGGADLEFTLSDLFAFGDLDGAGLDDAALVLVVTRSGRPHAVQVIAATNSSPVRTASTTLPSNSLVRQLTIESTTVIVRFRDRDAAAERERRYAFGSAELTLVSDTEAPPASLDTAFAYAIERVNVPASGETVLQRTLPPGVGADFVISLGEGQGYSLWAQSQFSNAILSVFGTRDQRTFVSRRDYVSQHTGVSSITQDYVVRVINVGGSELPFRLTVTAPGGTGSSRATHVTGLPNIEPPPGGFVRPTEEFPLAVLSPSAAASLEGREGRNAVAVLRLSDGALFTAGTSQPLEMVSAAKILTMAAVMARAESQGRPLEARELDLLWPMITFSDNDSATLLWHSLGGESGVADWLQRAAIGGVQPAPLGEWGASTATASALAVLLARLYSGGLVTPEHRDLALEMLSQVIDGQRWGVSAGTDDSGDAFVLKNGWFLESDGWQVVSAGLILPEEPARTYAIVIMTDRQETWEYGIETIESVARAVNESIHSLNLR